MSTYDYKKDMYGAICLEHASKCKSNIGFGAVLVKDGQIIGVGRNRHATIHERKTLSHVDYAIHAEQAAIYDALQNGHDVRGAAVYVLGMALSGANKGSLTTRTKKEFGCKKCPPSLERFNIDVYIPYVTGWARLTPQEAKQTAQEFCGDGKWAKFSKGLVKL